MFRLRPPPHARRLRQRLRILRLHRRYFRPSQLHESVGKATQFAYHAAGWKTNEVIVGMATNKFTCDPAGNLRTLSDGKNQLTSWGYDTYGRVTSKTNDNNTLILSYLYDASIRLTNRWSAAKGNTAYGYDATGNLTNINYPSKMGGKSVGFDIPYG